MSDSIYFHAPCFDGLICAAVAQDHLETVRGWQIERYVGVTYSEGDGSDWRATELPSRAAVVDSLYHADAAFWLDHHPDPFKVPAVRAAFDAAGTYGSRTLIFDSTCPAGAQLLWRHVAGGVSDRERYAEMVKWATITDSAAYPTVEDAIFGDAPALRIAQTLGTSIDQERLTAILRALRLGTLADVAASDLIAVPFADTRPRVEAGLARIGANLRLNFDERLLPGKIAFYEATVEPGDMLPRYGAFFFQRDIQYMASLVHGDRGSKISLSRNPWGAPTHAHLGEILEPFGGGGHAAAASLQLAIGNMDRARAIFPAIVHHIARAEYLGRAAQSA